MDKFFEGNCLIIRRGGSPDTYACFCCYLASCDLQLALHPELWLCADSTLPTHLWFITQMCCFFPSSIASQLMHAGGATALDEAGVPPNLIQTAGCWTLDTFTCYIQKNPSYLKHSSLAAPLLFLKDLFPFSITHTCNTSPSTSFKLSSLPPLPSSNLVF